jgi:hypothetical protein
MILLKLTMETSSLILSHRSHRYENQQMVDLMSDLSQPVGKEEVE